MDYEFIGVVAIVGDEGSGKSSMALSFPKPLFHFDIDVGGFDRAAWRLKRDNPDIRIYQCQQGEDLSGVDFTTYDIITKPYPKPLQVSKLMGQLTGNGPSARQLVLPKKVEGMKELWQLFISDFIYVCEQPVATISPDTSTLLWNIAHNTRLQELQEIQAYKWGNEHSNTAFPENEYRERLQPIEYGPANERMTAVLETSRSFRKNLVLTHYPTDEYGMVPNDKGNMVEGKTGKQVIDGFKHTAKLCDLVVWTSLKESRDGAKRVLTPVAKITKCGIAGMGLEAVGQEIVASFDGITSLRNIMSGGG